MSGVEDVEAKQTGHKPPYTPHHPVPTIHKYKEEKERREQQYDRPDGGQAEGPSKTDRIGEAWDTLRHGPEAANPSDETQPYNAENKNLVQDEDIADDHAGRVDAKKASDTGGDGETAEDTTEGLQNETDPKKARKAMKKFSADGTEREVTDPVTHLPVKVHDFTEKDLKATPKNRPPAGAELHTATGWRAANKSQEQLNSEQEDIQSAHSGMETVFPPPEYNAAMQHISGAFETVMIAGFGTLVVLSTVLMSLFSVKTEWTNKSKAMYVLVVSTISLALGSAVVLGLRQYLRNKIKNAWETEVWNAERQHGRKLVKSPTPESAQWLNSLVASVWPLINPDLFTSIADTLEDVMQASLPKMVRMVSVEDLGQGSEAFRILGVRWLPTAAAAKSVSEDGELHDPGNKKSDRSVPGKGQSSSDPGQAQSGDDAKEDENIAEGMEAEEGDFVNVELAFAYRPSAGKKGMKERAKNAHLYLAFYLIAGVRVPVWVEVHGIVGILRLRLQLTPDPPFFSLCTLTFLGQPKVDLACVPLLKKGPNLMDLPLISRFVQSSVDAAMAEYVAPKSLTLDLKDMLMGDDFKKDTTAQGVLVVTIKRASDFKEGDAGLGPLKHGSADPYVSVGWAKFGKPLWSTRVLQNNMEPYWEETCFVLVTPEELNVDERLRVQLWDSDRSTADDDLGRIELDVKGLMKGKESNGRMWNRQDGFKSLKAGEGMPGRLDWSVGYFSKTRITDDQLIAQEEDPDVENIDQLKKKVYAESEQKLREASKDESDEIEQQKAQDFKARQDELIIASPPPHQYPSGILSIQIHQITGLEMEAINKNKASKHENASDEQEEGDDLPSAYCTIILNHQKIFKTRTKPKNSKPFYNAGCERFIRDWRNTEVHISVRDSRVHEDDPLLGIIYFPLGKLLEKRSQIDSSFPISGGIGYGRARVSFVFRSVQLQAPKAMLGWDYGTLDIVPTVKGIHVPQELQGLRMKIRTNVNRAKLYSNTGDDRQGSWKTKKDRPARLAVKKRYASPLIVEFRKDATLSDHTPAFCVLWLKDIPDNEEQTVRLPIWRGDLGRAENNCMKEYGEKLGEIELKLTFWSGLSGYHASLAKKDSHLSDVMQVLDGCHDNNDMDWDDGSDSDTSSSGSDSESDADFKPKMIHPGTSSSLESDGKRGTMDQIKDYKDHSKQLHRRHRGLMQWKGPRTLAWMKHLAQKGENKVESVFKHSERSGVGVETEV